MSKTVTQKLYANISKLQSSDNGVEAITFTENGARYTVIPEKASGACELDTLAGLNKRHWSVMEIREGGRLSVTVDFSAQFDVNGTANLFLEVEEVHNRAQQTIGYHVEVNGKQVYFRTYEQISAGLNHYFVSVDRALVTDPKAVEITFINQSEETFYLNRAWLYDDFFKLAEEQGTYEKMEINGLYFNMQDARTLPTQYPEKFTMYEAGALLAVLYMNNSNMSNAEAIAEYVDLSTQANIPVHIMPSRWWGGTPFGPDGKGGYFEDLEYGQIVYNSAEDSYQPTIPNCWNNTYWSSLNHPHGNAVAAERLKFFGKTLSELSALKQIQTGKTQYPYNVYLEHGIGYWNINDLDGADYSDFVMEAAKKDGFELKPDDTLTDDEKMWFLKNLATYFDDEAVAVKAGMGTDPIQVVKGEIRYPLRQLYDFIYSHGVQCGLYPSNDNKKIGAWESGMGYNMWPSYEVYVFNDYRNYDYVLPHGKNGCANLEMTMINKEEFQRYIRDCYAYGATFVTMFNQKKEGENEAIREIDNIDDQKAAILKHYDRYSLWIDYRGNYRADMLVNKDPYVESYEHLEMSPDGLLIPCETGKAGVVTYKLTNNGETFTNGLLFQLQGKVSGVESNSLEIYAGATRDELHKIADFVNGEKVDFFNQNTQREYDLAAVANGHKEVYVQLRLKATDFHNRVQVRMVKAVMPWGEKTGNSNGYVPTLKESRLQSLWVSQRAVTERAIRLYGESAPESGVVMKNAQVLYESGLYKKAYSLLSGEQSLLLPARFVVDSYGPLGRYPIEVSLQNEGGVIVTLMEVTEDRCRFALGGDCDQEVCLTFSELTDGVYMLSEENGVYTLEKFAEGVGDRINAVDGKATLVVKYTVPQKEKPANMQVAGKVNSASENAVSMELQDMSISDYDSNILFPFAANVEYIRRADGSMETEAVLPQKGDMVIVTLDGEGLVSKLEAVYGCESGSVKRMIPASLVGGTHHNGIIEMESGNRYELSFGRTETMMDTVVLKGLAKNFDIKTISESLKEGDQITLTYFPYAAEDRLKRILEITQPAKDLFFEDFEGDWTSRAVEMQNYYAGPIDQNICKKCIYPQVDSTNAYLIYEIRNDTVIRNAAVEYRGRSINDSPNMTTFYISTDKIHWVKVHEFKSSDLGSSNFNNPRAFNITDQVRGTDKFYLKLETFTTKDTWASICQLCVRADG